VRKAHWESENREFWGRSHIDIENAEIPIGA
jgi:hypothetical protein